MTVEVWFTLQQEEAGWPPFREESVLALPQSEGQYQVASTPVFTPSVAVGDVVAAEEHNGQLWATHVERQGDHWCARVVPLDGAPLAPVADFFEELGADVTETDYGVVTVDVPPEVDVDRVMNALEDGFEAGQWDYNLGVFPDKYQGESRAGRSPP